MSKVSSIGMSESALDRRERLLNAYTKPKRAVNDERRQINEAEYTTRKEYTSKNQAFGAVW